MFGRCLAVPVVAFLVLASLPASADTIDATSHVTAATVFSDRALVTRSAKVHVPAGAHIIAVNDMPAGLNEASIRVQGKSLAEVKIGTVEVKHVYLTEQANAAERDKNAALEAKSDERSYAEGEIKALQAREDFINRIVANGADQHDKDGTVKLDFAPEKWAAALNTLQTALTETEKQLVAKNIAVRKIDEQIAQLQAELNQVRSTQAKERRNIQINVEAAQAADVDLSLTYQTSGAVWRPVYDARLDTASGELDLEQYGQVSQQTGEDWSDIDLTLSTAQPSAGSEMPRMVEWWVRLFQSMQNMNEAEMHVAPGGKASPYFLQQMKKDEALAGGRVALPTPIGAPVDAAALADKAELDAQQAMATVQTTEYAADFHVPGHASLKSVRDASKMFIGAVHMKAALEARTSPRLTPQAYLFAKITNGENYPLISGAVAKYRDGTFIGNAPFALLRSGEKADLSFGVDDRVKVTYKHIKEEQANPTLIVMGDMKVEREYQAKIQNLHKDAIAITLFEQYPVAADPDVKVELLDDETTAGYAKDPDNRQGVIAWTATYNPKEEKTFVIGFKVKYPKDRQISGL